MALLNEFVAIFIHYCAEIWWSLAIGFLISGLFYKFIPSDLVERHLGEKGLRPIIFSSLVGTLLPVCCIGSLPIAVTLKRKGATMGAVLAFLVATPATSVSALFVCWKLMGLGFTAYIFFAVIVMAIVTGLIAHRVPVQSVQTQANGMSKSCHDSGQEKDEAKVSTVQKIQQAVRYAFVILPKEMGGEILLGIAIASIITLSDPIQQFIRDHLIGVVGYAFVLVTGLLTYVCSTASVPLADALVNSGMSLGQALCYLIVGPVTSYGTILVIKKDFGGSILTLYLVCICLGAIISGFVYDILFKTL